MKILIDIPEAFEVDYNADRFADFFHRCFADMDTCCGNYEQETAEMMEKAFADSRLYDPDKVVEQLEEKTELAFQRHMNCPKNSPCYQRYQEQYLQRKMCLEIVKAGGTDAEH